MGSGQDGTAPGVQARCQPLGSVLLVGRGDLDRGDLDGGGLLADFDFGALDVVVWQLALRGLNLHAGQFGILGLVDLAAGDGKPDYADCGELDEMLHAVFLHAAKTRQFGIGRIR